MVKYNYPMEAKDEDGTVYSFLKAYPNRYARYLHPKGNYSKCFTAFELGLLDSTQQVLDIQAKEEERRLRK